MRYAVLNYMRFMTHVTVTVKIKNIEFAIPGGLSQTANSVNTYTRYTTTLPPYDSNDSGEISHNCSINKSNCPNEQLTDKNNDYKIST